VKTRLVPPLTDEEAARLARAFVADLARRLSLIEARLVLALPPGSGHGAFAAVLPADARISDQGPGDLGAKLAHATAEEFRRGARVVAVIGSDHPDLPRAQVAAALEAARNGRVGWVTTRDGGYACVALPRPLPGLFERVPWSTRDVADVTRNNARHLGVVLEETGPWYDLDAPGDVDRFLAEPGASRESPDTWGVLTALVPAWEERRRSHG
jgi:hypothetical protein